MGLRWEFLDDLIESEPRELAFVEVSPENYMRRGGYYPAQLERIRDLYPVITHGLTLSLGGNTPPPGDYLGELRGEIARVGSPWHSDHLCASTVGPRVLHDLFPVQHSVASADRIADRVRAAEDRLGVPMAVENISWYAHPGRAEITEEALINRVLDRSGCSLLLDVNNVYVNSLNHGFDARAFIDALPLDRVIQLHVAGHTKNDWGLVVDTHGAPVADPVVALLEYVVERTGPVPVLLERDNFVPPLAELLAEVEILDAAYRRALARRPA